MSYIDWTTTCMLQQKIIYNSLLYLEKLTLLCLFGKAHKQSCTWRAHKWKVLKGFKHLCKVLIPLWKKAEFLLRSNQSKSNSSTIFCWLLKKKKKLLDGYVFNPQTNENFSWNNMLHPPSSKTFLSMEKCSKVPLIAKLIN